MASESPAKIKCEGINQIAIVVKDLETVAKHYWNILGVGPWYVYDWEAPLVYDRKYHGQTVWASEKIALAQVGDVQLELVQPVEGPSIYRDWLEEHGEGLHHLNFLVDDVDKAAGLLAEQGFMSIQSGRFEPKDQKGAYNYIDIKPLRTIWEPVHIGEVIGGSPTVFPAGAEGGPGVGEESPSKIKCKGINQVAIVVKDLERVAKHYWNILGIGPWYMYDWEAPLVYDRKYRGQTVWAREKIALAQAGGVQLELVQPVEGPSIYGDWLEEHGEGLHHLNFLVDDVDKAAELLAEQGFMSIQSGRFEPKDQKGAYNYVDIKPLRTIWEPVHLGEVIGGTPTVFP